MPTALASPDLSDDALKHMIAEAERSFDYLSSTPHTFALCKLMLAHEFMFSDRQTPIDSSVEFLKTRAELLGVPGIVTDRDFVFAIKMFGIKIWQKKSMFYFRGEQAASTGTGVRRVRDGVTVDFKIKPLDDAAAMKDLEFYLYSGSKRTKIQLNEIQSASNKLLRDHRDRELALLLGELRGKRKLSIGDARDLLRNEYDVKDHEFARIRAKAIELGVFTPGRAAAKESSRVTLDADVLEFLGLVRAKKRGAGVRDNQLTLTKLLNSAIRDMHLVAYGEPLPRAAKVARAG
ncbi:hypothetical protein [Cupriavidus sp. TMH.W2]|uniref:hypothetical protein n=1 Tax=Cupriavidus sp. TMH.W2 TaxID=3434465 RepID=UPI003D78AB90